MNSAEEFGQELTELIKKYKYGNITGIPEVIISNHMIRSFISFFETIKEREAYDQQISELIRQRPLSHEETLDILKKRFQDLLRKREIIE